MKEHLSEVFILCVLCFFYLNFLFYLAHVPRQGVNKMMWLLLFAELSCRLFLYTVIGVDGFQELEPEL